MKSTKEESSSRHLWWWLAVAGIVIIGLLTYCMYRTEKLSKAVSDVPASRQVMIIAEQMVKEVKPPPTMSSLQYAYVASTYYDVIQTSTTSNALYASQKVLLMLYPDKKTEIEQRITQLAKDYELQVPKDDEASATAKEVVTKYTTRYMSDKHTLPWDGVIPSGEDKWHKTATDPFTPRAGEWQRWNVKDAIEVPAPPEYGSQQDLQELEHVRQVSAARTGDQVNKINFWGGAPGTEAPAGIWQNQTFVTLKGDLPKNTATADKLYAEIQRDVAQTISDAFMECWKVKYIYWTARPDMRDTSIKTAMKDPPFPSYVSGHSTISKAAADVLSVLAPKHAVQFEAMAVEARDSRLQAGIHFEIDNLVGFQLGTDVAKQVVTDMGLKQLIQ